MEPRIDSSLNTCSLGVKHGNQSVEELFSRGGLTFRENGAHQHIDYVSEDIARHEILPTTEEHRSDAVVGLDSILVGKVIFHDDFLGGGDIEERRSPFGNQLFVVFHLTAHNNDGGHGSSQNLELTDSSSSMAFQHSMNGPLEWEVLLSTVSVTCFKLAEIVY